MVLLAEIIYEATIPLPPPTGSPKKDVVFFWGGFGGEQVLSWQSHGVALTTCELGNGTWSVPFQGSRADAKQMRGKRSSAGSTAREGAPKGRKESPHFRRLLEGAVTASEACFGVVTEGVALL